MFSITRTGVLSYCGYTRLSFKIVKESSFSLKSTTVSSWISLKSLSSSSSIQAKSISKTLPLQGLRFKTRPTHKTRNKNERDNKTRTPEH